MSSSLAASSSQKMSTALKKVKGNLERLFEKNLTDMIRGIRNNKDNEAKFISQCIEEIKQELKQDNIAVKANAVAKLSYLQMLGYDISWAAFNIIEVMSSTKFTFKRTGYLAASQCFNENTDVLMLTTNLIRKDLNSASMYESGVALGGLSCFVTPDLARDLANDVVTLLTSSKPYIRKRACLLLYKVFLRYPDALRPTFGRLKEKLEDPDPGVQSAAVNVICELARKNPKNYLSLAPVFFKLMTTSTNNWMLIKIIKLFGALTPLEPRLGKKLIEPLTNLINSTSAMSLLYECINTVIAVLISISSEAPGDHTASIQLCVQKLSVLIEDTDQNLKYLGLLAMGKILITHPKAVQGHKDLILSCLDDKDESIRLRALDLLYGMVSKKNIMEIVKRLLQHHLTAEGSAYRDELLAKIIQICSHNNYQYITNFEWYVSVLVELTRVEGTKHGQLIAEQMLDVAVRVQSVRHFAISQMALLIENAHLLYRSSMCEVLYAAAWICGEYAEHLRNPQNVLESLLRTKVGAMPGHIQSIFIQNIAKLYSMLLTDAEKEEDWDKIFMLDNLLLSKLPQYEQSECLEVQERACTIVQLMRQIDKLHKNSEFVGEDLASLFEGELMPVAPKAQRKVPVPPGLDLDAWINEPPPESSSESEPEPETKPAASTEFFVKQAHAEQETKKRYEPSEEELKKARQARLAELETNPHYLKSGASSKPKRPDGLRRESSKDSQLPPVVSLDLQSPLDIPGMVGLDKYMEQQQKTISWKKAKKERKGKDEKKGKKGKKKAAAVDESSEGEETGDVVHEVYRDAGDMPEGAKSTDDEEPHAKEDPYKALDINLDEPLRDEEKLPVPHHRFSSPKAEDLPKLPKSSKESPMKEKKKSKKNKEEEPKKKKKAKADIGEEKKKKEKTKTKVSSVGETVTKKAESKKVAEVDLWLEESTNNGLINNAVQSPEQNVIITPVETADGMLEKKKTKVKKERKKSTSSGKKEKKSALLEALTETADNSQLRVHDRAEYEEASGACTPSRQECNSSPGTPQHPTIGDGSPTPTPVPEMSSYRPLAENQHVKLAYDTKANANEAHEIFVSVVMTNLTDKQLKQLEFNVLDSLNTKLIREITANGGGVAVPFTLLPSHSNEHQFRFSVQAINMPQKLRGTLTYSVITEDGTIPEKLDFHLRLPCIAFTVPISASKNSFATLLTSGDLSSKNSVKCAISDSFQIILAKICFYAHFTIVERVESSASLYCQTIQEQPLCLLVKQQGETVQIDGKSTDAQLLSYVLQEIREILAETRSR